MHKPSIFPLLSVLGLLLLATTPTVTEVRAADGDLPNAAVIADALDAEPADSTDDLGDALEAARNSVDEAISFDARIAEATGEQRAVLIAQQSAKAEAAGGALFELVEIVVLQDGERDVPKEARNQTSALLDEVSAWMVRQIELEASELQRVRASRDEAAAEEYPAIDERLGQINGRYDQLLKSLFRTHEARVSLGIDTTASAARFDELLKERSAERAGAVRVTRKRLADIDRQAASADEEEAKRLGSLRTQQTALLGERVESLRALSTLLEQRGVSAAEYRQLIIEATGKVTVDIFNREVATGLFQDAWKRTKSWLSENAPGIVFNLILGLAIFMGGHFFGRLSQRLIRRTLARARTPVSRLFQDFLISSAYRIALSLGVLVALSQLGVEVAPILAGLGVASFIVGFALQDTLSNFAAGMLILAYRPFDVGDVVNAGGVAGRVDAMTLVSTTVLTFDNQRLIVPNRKIWGDVITNVTAESVRRVDLKFGISYGDNIEQAERVLREIVESHPKILETPEPVIRLHELGDSSVNFVVRPWAATVDYWEVYWDLTREVKHRFDAEGISIPFPQRDVHFYPEGGASS